MEIYETRSEIGKKHNWLLSLVLLVLIIFGSMAIMQGLSLFLVPPLFGIPVDDILYIFGGNYEHPNARLAFLFMQGVGSGLGFLVGSLIYIKFIDRGTLRWKQQLKNTKFNQSILIVPILLSFVTVNSLVIYWNTQISFPDFMKSFEIYAQTQEAEMMRLTQYFTDFANVGEFLLGILVIGILAGVGEEYLFRGLLQPKLHQYTGNPHVAIWLTAAIFSAIHFQFCGFFPRMLLGALFGYLYLYSGSLIYPIAAHVLNNAFTVTMVYFSKIGWVEFNIEDSSQLEWHYLIIGLVIFLFSFKRFIDQSHNSPFHGKMADRHHH
ncbi:CPBP family intramembrane metalloprotease [Litoribacter alkaliphilus]|uniref:CPBP family intramembrane metalloprotease n=1 Tax=Litoribacter ruber TaxID=702568 RepID=A0AAP2CFK1_9BACT|nr:CPBP family intramembrane glutamic endopeptidase [Litoribacter alkaliphilus]MBS9523666.1 CPBP family intramembrane metalloprotease [Litoribacter alkaliphilus]